MRTRPTTRRKARAARRVWDCYRRLLKKFGPQHWWPARTPFEVCVGAILTQNTAWSNVERAIANLRQAGMLNARDLHRLPTGRLARLIRPAGYFNVKARRLKNFVSVLVGKHGGRLDRLFQGDAWAARARLLDINGIGRETADSILLYAGNRPIFVVDAYTRRIFSRHGLVRMDADYDEIRLFFENALGELKGARRVKVFNEFHALIVRVGKDLCRKRIPRCGLCPLKPLLPNPAPSDRLSP